MEENDMLFVNKNPKCLIRKPSKMIIFWRCHQVNIVFWLTLAALFTAWALMPEPY